jgi:DNA-binding Lrp family transcriptional regulator
MARFRRASYEHDDIARCGMRILARKPMRGWRFDAGASVDSAIESRGIGGVHTGTTTVPKRLDDIDLRILSALQRDGRITYQKLSEVVGLSPRPCLERVRRLERDRFIIGYVTRIDMRRLVDLVVVLVQMHVRQGREIRPRFEQRMRECPEVLECFELSGQFDYIVKVACTSLAAYQELTESWINDGSLHVERIESNIVLRAAKDGTLYPIELAASERPVFRRT